MKDTGKQPRLPKLAAISSLVELLNAISEAKLPAAGRYLALTGLRESLMAVVNVIDHLLEHTDIPMSRASLADRLCNEQGAAVISLVAKRIRSITGKNAQKRRGDLAAIITTGFQSLAGCSCGNATAELETFYRKENREEPNVTAQAA